MNIERKKNLWNIIFEIILIILVIIAIKIIPENNNFIYILPESSAIGIIGSSDGPTTILMGRGFDLINFHKNLILAITMISLFILLIIDIIGFIKSIRYSNKYKIKIISSIDLYLIILIFFTFPIFGLRYIGISVLLNIVLLTIIFIKEILLKIIKHEEANGMRYNCV